MKTQLATLCYLKKDGKTLMLLRNKKDNDVHEGKWNGLGGKFNSGETPEECVIREVKEECGLTLVNPIMKGVLVFPEFTPQTDWTVFVFVANQFMGKMEESDEGQLEWIEDQKIMSLNLWEGDKIFLEWLDQDKFFSGKFIYKDKKFISHDVVFHQIQNPKTKSQNEI